MSKPHGPVIPQQPPKTRVTCPHGHTIRTRMPPGTQLHCSPCGQEGRKDVTVTVPAPLPAIRPETYQGTPQDIAVIMRRKTGPERWYCAGCRGSVICPAPGKPPLGWLEIQAGMPGLEESQLTLMLRACCTEHLALALPELRERLNDSPWMPPDSDGPARNLAALMRETPKRRS